MSKTCNRCKMCGEFSDMAQIPYIEHKKRIFKAYQRENRLVWIAILTNAAWLSMVIWLIVAR